VHAALTDNLSQDRQATLMLQSLSAQAGIRKFVHLSTIAVYGNPASGTITEETPPIPAPDEYSRTKLAIEAALRTNLQVPEMIFLRLGCVYGPGAGWWTDGLLRLMETGKVILINEGSGTANLIHVADVAALIVLVLARSNPPFDIFNVTDGMPVPWCRYYSQLEGILGRTATASMSVAGAREYGKKWLKPSLFRRAIRRLAGAELVHPLDDCGIDGLASRAIYSNRKASTALGFRAMYDLQRGIQTVKFHRDPVIHAAMSSSEGSCEG
jgi:nucleoside-diphosphate-sugar epimerase